MVEEINNHIFLKYFPTEGSLAGRIYAFYLNLDKEEVSVNYPVSELDETTDWFISHKYPTTKEWIIEQLQYITSDYKEYLKANQKPTLVEIFNKCHSTGRITYNKDMIVP